MPCPLHPAGDCPTPPLRPCWLYANRTDYQELWDRVPIARTRTVATGPCVFLGEDPVLAVRLVPLGLNPVLDYRECGHPETPLGLYVCRCRGCNSTCRGYVANVV